MRFRKLRIAWSVVWGIVAVLLIVLWVRSYWCFDTCSVCFDGNRGHWLGSIAGEIRYGRPIDASGAHGLRWQTYDEPVNEWLQHESPRNSVFGFRWGKSPQGPHGCPIVPHWFPVLFFGLIAAAPWLPRRFTLSTLLIATTLVAVVLGLFVWLR
jgi:hypothetical protein